MQDAGPWPEVEGVNPPHTRAPSPAARPEKARPGIELACFRE